MLQKPVEIQVGGRSVVNKDITQLVEVREEEDRFLRLLEVVASHLPMPNVFAGPLCLYQRCCIYHLNSRGLQCAAEGYVLVNIIVLR